MRIDCFLRKTSSLKSFADVYVSETSTIKTTKITIEISILSSSIDLSRDIEAEYDFRSWSYAKIKSSLTSDFSVEEICLNFDAEITLDDRKFFKSQTSDTSIRKITISLSVRGLRIYKHNSDEYVIANFYFDELDTHDQLARAHFRRELNLIDDLKTNVFIEMNILDLERFNIDLFAKLVFIKSCDVTITLKVKSRAFDNAIIQSIHLRKITVMSSNSQILIVVHHDHLLERDFLFEFDSRNEVSLFAHIIDVSLHDVLIRNESNHAVQLPRNLRLSIVSELNYSNVFFVDFSKNMLDMTIRKSKTTHKSSWFKKVMIVITDALATMVSILQKSSMTSSKTFAIAYVVAIFEMMILDDDLSKCFAAHVLSNDVTIYDFDTEIIRSLIQIVDSFSTLWKENEFATLFEENWMKIFLKSDWESRVFEKAKIYSLEARDKALVDKTFDVLHEKGKLFWINEFTSFKYLVFCVWKNDEKSVLKRRVVVDIRDLNVISQSDAYSLSLQGKIIIFVQDYRYITVIDCASFFYQWRVHLSNRHKLTVVSHRDQESFNVIVMRYRNFIVYVQRQIDRLLRASRSFARAYVDDIVVAFATLEEHLSHLRQIVQILVDNNIFIKLIKAFIDYSIVQLLSQRINFFELFISEEKLRVIVKLRFFITLRQLEIYLELTSWLREYVSFYVDVSKSLQKRKTKLLRSDLVTERERKFFFAKTRIRDSTNLKKIFFFSLQTLLSRLSYLVHVDKARQLFVDLDDSKEFDFEVMIYHVKNWNEKNYLKRFQIQSILFLSRLLTFAETRYWLTKLELIEIVWVLKKIRHLVESTDSSLSTIIFTNHGAALRIKKQTSLSISCIDKLNLRLVRVSDYIQRFNLELRHKSNKQHIVLDALSRLVSVNTNFAKDFENEGELDILFICALIEIDEVFRKRVIENYKIDLNWQKIFAMLDIIEAANENVSKIPFQRENELIFRMKNYISDDHAYQSHRLCISFVVIKDVFDIVHDDESEHLEFVKCYERVSTSWYIRELSRYLRDYLKHCSKCQIY